MSPIASEAAATARGELRAQFDQIRAHSKQLSARLSAEDHNLQSMPDASPIKWHLAHTTWFFETLILQPHMRGYRVYDARFARLFNSYYEALGPRHPRPQRGMLSRPSLTEVWTYRDAVDRAIREWLATASDTEFAAAMETLVLGLHHEQQHQELLLTDIKHAFSLNPLLPAYHSQTPTVSRESEQAWLACPAGIRQCGDDHQGFAFDNERPHHRVWLEAFEFSSRLVNCGEYLAFMRDGGYQRPELWLSDGWRWINDNNIRAPLYWSDERGREYFTLYGVQPIDLAAPVCHINYYEASAYAEWAHARLPTEFEWETAARHRNVSPTINNSFHPSTTAGSELRELFGATWQWTRSAYLPYPGFKPLAGYAAEYNGKFMSGQMVLRGSSCATPPHHSRITYRNFFPSDARWQFSGIRLARDLS